MVADFSIFTSRFHVTGTLRLETALRVGAGGVSGATEQDLPVLKDLTGKPYIPGSSFKGAYRAHLEQLLRGIDPRLACVSVPRAEDPSPASAGCLTQKEVGDLKDQIEREFRDRPAEGDAELCRTILERSCWVCRLCGAPWLASKLMVRDMSVSDDTWFGHYLVRDGVGIDRDTETAAANLKYDFEAVPAGTEFAFEMVVDNATDAELGLALLGLREFEDEMVPLGGGRSRGLGKVKLLLDWQAATLVTRDGLKAYLLDRTPTKSLAREDERRKFWEMFLSELGQGGKSHA